MPLEPENLRHLEAAQGYCELGMYLDADAELEKIDPDVQHVPEVLGVRIEIYRNLKKWELMQAVAKRLATVFDDQPHWWICWAYATRRADSLEDARRILLTALEHHPMVANVHYNLACYECQLGDVESARSFLKQAFDLDLECRLLALEDEDLVPLWTELRS